MHETRTKWITAVFVILGFVGWAAVAVWLVSEPNTAYYAGSGLSSDDDEWTYRKDGALRCASVLGGPALADPEDWEAARKAEGNAEVDEDVIVEDAEEYEIDSWVVGTCNQLRQQRIGLSMVVGLPSTVLLVFGFGRVRWDWR